MTKLLASGALVLALVAAAIALLKAFGVAIDDGQSAAITGLVAAVLALLGVWFHPDLPPNKTT